MKTREMREEERMGTRRGDHFSLIEKNGKGKKRYKTRGRQKRGYRRPGKKRFTCEIIKG